MISRLGPFSATLPVLSKSKPSKALSKSSRAWLARQAVDPHVRLRSPENYRSRSAYKLLELDGRFGFLGKVRRRIINANSDAVPDEAETASDNMGGEDGEGRYEESAVNLLRRKAVVVDLGAAPGGWSQVVARRMGWPTEPDDDTKENATDRNDIDSDLPTTKEGDWESKLIQQNVYAVGIDLLRIYPIPGVHTLQMDFLSSQVATRFDALLRNFDDHPHASSRSPQLRAAVAPRRPIVDIVLSDMAANMTGHRMTDVEASLQLSEAVLAFVYMYLKTAKEIGKSDGGVLVLKHFTHPLLKEFEQRLHEVFRFVHTVKPKSSRKTSAEQYWVCLGYRLPSHQAGLP